MKARLAQSNWIRGLRGVIWCRCVPNFVYVAYRVNELIEDANNELPDALLQFIARLIGRSSGGAGMVKSGLHTRLPSVHAFGAGE
jgi:hypothetical protein